MNYTPFLIIGAGPYSIAAAAYAKSLGVEVNVVGKPLDFWKTNMPRGMFLRSGPDWHLDAREVATFEAYVNERKLTSQQIRPVPLDTFLDYASWFMGQYALAPQPAYVTHLTRANGAYTATLDNGSQIHADQVLLSLGFAFFKHYPSELIEKLPPGSYIHTCDTVDFEFYRGKRVLIVGGRQSAFEWAALINEKGADEVHITYRHATPEFAESRLVLGAADGPADIGRSWLVAQPLARRSGRIRHRFWAAGRLTLEAWLDARVHQPNIHLHKNNGHCRSASTI